MPFIWEGSSCNEGKAFLKCENSPGHAIITKCFYPF